MIAMQSSLQIVVTVMNEPDNHKQGSFVHTGLP